MTVTAKPKWKPGPVWCGGPDDRETGKQTAVATPGASLGNLGVWCNPDYPTGSDYRWVITHQPSGKLVGNGSTRRKARALAEWLSDRFDLSVLDRAAREEWRDGDQEILWKIRTFLRHAQATGEPPTA